MATFKEIDEAVRTLRGSGAEQLALLHCTSVYPAPADAMNLRRMPELAARFGCPVGLSDHSREAAVPVAAVALGASIVEKHLTLENPESPTCDASFSLFPAEFREMARAVRAAWCALGEALAVPCAAEADSRRFRRSLFVVADVKAGEPLTLENIRSIRPAAGLPPKHLDDVLGRPARRDLARGTPLGWEDIG